MDHGVFLREVRSARLHGRGYPVRESNRWQERGAHRRGDTCIQGIAAFILGAAAGEPVMIVVDANNHGMAVVPGVNTDIKTIKDLKGKKVAIRWARRNRP
jgi:hypothetical protein